MLASESTAGTIYGAPLLAGQATAERIETFTDRIFRERNHEAKFAKRHADRVSECWGYRVDGEAVSYFWLSRGGDVPLWRKAVLSTECAYVWDCYTAEPFRRRGYFTRALQDGRMLGGTKTVLTAVTDGNQASARVIGKMFAVLTRYRIRRFGSIYITNGRLGRVVVVPRLPD